MTEEITKRVYSLNGGPQDLNNLYFMSLDEVVGFIKTDLEEITDIEADSESYSIDIKLMTQKEIDDLPEYQF